MHILNAILKRTRPGSRDAVKDKSHIKGSMRLYAMNSQ